MGADDIARYVHAVRAQFRLTLTSYRTRLISDTLGPWDPLVVDCPSPVLYNTTYCYDQIINTYLHTNEYLEINQN